MDYAFIKKYFQRILSTKGKQNEHEKKKNISFTQIS